MKFPRYGKNKTCSKPPTSWEQQSSSEVLPLLPNSSLACNVHNSSNRCNTHRCSDFCSGGKDTRNGHHCGSHCRVGIERPGRALGQVMPIRHWSMDWTPPVWNESLSQSHCESPVCEFCQKKLCETYMEVSMSPHLIVAWLHLGCSIDGNAVQTSKTQLCHSHRKYIGVNARQVCPASSNCEYTTCSEFDAIANHIPVAIHPKSYPTKWFPQ